MNPWLLGAMGKGLCCMASWCNLVSCGDIAAEEDCERIEQGHRETQRGGRTKKGKIRQQESSQYKRAEKIDNRRK